MIRLIKGYIPEDAIRWRNDPRISNFTRQNGLISTEQHQRWLQTHKQDSSIQMFGVEWMNEESENRYTSYPMVGVCGFTSIRLDHGSAEFSLYIAPAVHGQGFGEAALKELFRYGFHHLRLHCIWGESFVGNPALHLFDKLGMKRDGILRGRYFKNGEHRDAVAISILREEAKLCPWWNG